MAFRRRFKRRNGRLRRFLSGARSRRSVFRVVKRAVKSVLETKRVAYKFPASTLTTYGSGCLVGSGKLNDASPTFKFGDWFGVDGDPWIFNATALIQQGQTDWTRAGDKLNLNSLYLKFMFENVSNAVAMPIIRLLIVQWLPSSDMGKDDLFEDTSLRIPVNAATPMDSPPYAGRFYNKDKMQSMRILHDESWVLGGMGVTCPHGSTTTVDSRSTAVRELTVTKFPFSSVKYDNGTTVCNNRVYVVVCGTGTTSSDGSGPFSVVRFQGCIRLSYTE